jgi:GntR family transcriptional regulator
LPALLSTQSHVPLYFQLSQHLRDRIRTGEFDKQVALPTEDQLCEQYGVSRTTVRQAMNDLTAQRLIVRRRGLGTFVAEPPSAQKMVSLVGSIHQALHYIKGLTYAQLSRRDVVPPPEIAEKLRLNDAQKARCLEATGYLNDEPLVFANLYFPLQFGNLLAKEDFTTGTPVVHTLEKRLGRNAVKAEQTVEPEKADATVAAALGIARGTAILKITRVFHLADDAPLEVSVTRYHPQRYKLHIELVERPPY